MARLVLVTALLVPACGSGAAVDPSVRELRGVVVPPSYQVSVAATVSLEEGLELLDSHDAAFIRREMERVPRPDQSDVVKWDFFRRGRRADPTRRPSEVVVANYWPRRLRVSVICLVNGGQVACSDDAEVWRIDLDEPGLAIVELPDAEGRRDVLVLKENEFWVLPLSQVVPIDGDDPPISDRGHPPPVIANPLGGCNWVLLMDDLEPRDTFKPMRTRSSGPVYLVISVCPDQPSYEMRPLIVVDETTVAQVDAFQPFVAQPGTTYAWELPGALLAAGSKIRAAVVRRAPLGGIWITHPLVTAADPEG